MSTETLVVTCSASFFLATALAFSTLDPRAGLLQGIASALLLNSLLVALAGVFLSLALPDLLPLGGMLTVIAVAGVLILRSPPRGDEARPQAVPIL